MNLQFSTALRDNFVVASISVFAFLWTTVTVGRTSFRETCQHAIGLLNGVPLVSIFVVFAVIRNLPQFGWLHP